MNNGPITNQNIKVLLARLFVTILANLDDDLLPVVHEAVVSRLLR